MNELPAPHRAAVRHSIKAEFGSIYAFERTLGFPAGDIGAMLRGPTAFSFSYYSRFLEAVEDLTGLHIPPPVPPETDMLAALQRAGRIKSPEAEAGRAFRTVAEGWIFPGLFPSPELFARWPVPLRVMWRALRKADEITMAARPHLPTVTSTTWNIAVENEQPAVLGMFPRTPEARAEMKTLRLGLDTLKELLAGGLPVDDPLPPLQLFDFEAESRSRREDLGEKSRAAVVAAASTSIRLAALESGLSASSIKSLRRVAKTRPDLLAEIEAGRITINAAGLQAGVVKSTYKRRGTPIGQPPKWPPQSAGSWKIFRSIQARDPELAARVERQEISVNAAGVACGVVKSKNPRRSAP